MILLYQVDSLPGWPAMQAAIAMKRYSYRLVQPSEYSIPLGQLAASAPAASPALPVSPLPQPMMVLCGLDAPEVSRFLDLLRQVGAPSIGLKAVLTDTTRTWNSLQLYEELCKEHAYFHPRKDQ